MTDIYDYISFNIIHTSNILNYFQWLVEYKDFYRDLITSTMKTSQLPVWYNIYRCFIGIDWFVCTRVPGHSETKKMAVTGNKYYKSISIASFLTKTIWLIDPNDDTQ